MTAAAVGDFVVVVVVVVDDDLITDSKLYYMNCSGSLLANL